MPNTGRQGGLKLGPRPDDRVLSRPFGRITPMIGPTTVNSGVRSLRLLRKVGRRTPASRSFGRRLLVVRSSGPRPFGRTSVRAARVGAARSFGDPWLGRRCLRLRTIGFRLACLRLLRLRWFGLRSSGWCRFSLSGWSDRPENFPTRVAFGLRMGGLRMHGLRFLGSRLVGARALGPRSFGFRALARPGPSRSSSRASGYPVSDHWLVPSFVVRSFQAA